jgi:hypothetical protein
VVIKGVRVYVEGGGDVRSQQARLRLGFANLFKSLLGGLPQPKVIACGGRSKAFEDFKDGLRKHADSLCLLLVDSEAPVAEGASSWEHVRQRVGDGWVRPEVAGDDQLFFMAQAMEAWLIADVEALTKFYGQKFRAQDIPTRANVEEVPKRDLFDGLARATRETRTAYCKSDGLVLIGKISAAKVRERSAVHAEKFFERLRGAVACLRTR